jgi:transposase InsO family protein
MREQGGKEIDMSKMMTIAELQRQLAARERQVKRLLAERGKVAKQLADVDRQIEALGGKAPAAKKRPGRKPSKGAAKRRARRMPKNVKPLVEYVKDVLAGAKAGLRVKDVEAAVKKAGYKTFSKEFYGQVAVALREGPFQKVSRGVYKLKGAKKVAKRKAGKKAPVKKAPKTAAPEPKAKE